MEAEDHQHFGDFSFCTVSELEKAEMGLHFQTCLLCACGSVEHLNLSQLTIFMASCSWRLFKFPWLSVRCFSPTRSQHVDHGIQLSSRDVCCMFDPRSETKQDVVITGAIPRVPHWELLSFCMFLTTHVELNVSEESRAVFAELFEAPPPTHRH